MKAPKQPCQTIIPWLKANLGKTCIAPLTGSDAKALMAAVQIIQLYSYVGDVRVLEAFATVVAFMQPSTQELAYHAIAHVMDWSDREKIWASADLPYMHFRRCAFEPGGRERV